MLGSGTYWLATMLVSEEPGVNTRPRLLKALAELYSSVQSTWPLPFCGTCMGYSANMEEGLPDEADRMGQEETASKPRAPGLVELGKEASWAEGRARARESGITVPGT